MPWPLVSWRGLIGTLRQINLGPFFRSLSPTCGRTGIFICAGSHSGEIPLVRHGDADFGSGRKEDQMNRLNWSDVAPAGAKALYGVHHYITSNTALPAELIHLVFLRVSQINGCAHCIDLHTRDLLKTMPIDKIALLPVWHEVPHLFPDQYRAALAWAEEVTRVSETHASDEAYAAAAEAFEAKDLVDLTIAIAAMNAFNRLGAPFRLPVAAKP
ncbi:MAG TPA: carboxymuconolactone decarboxylase family protein [Sphingopyxis sp.]|nr:carboxymuconolactone decarboxylase family protein [Sphingopyxis sp.]